MLMVNEIFGPTIQGEGPSAGRSCVFLRLAACNLFCEYCDTPYTWNWIGTDFKHPEKFDRKKEVHKIPNDHVIEKIKECNIGDGVNDNGLTPPPPIDLLVISGGEPMLQQQRLFQPIRKLVNLGWDVEIETNGTVPCRPYFVDLLHQINCSPKLANSGVPERNRISPPVLTELVAMPKTNFKFVVKDQRDIDEIRQLVSRFRMTNVWLMPEGRTRDELVWSTPLVEQLAAENGWRFSRRLHIEQFGSQRGV